MPGIYERDQVLKFQEVGDVIFVAESDKTPFSRLLKRGKRPVQMLSEWPVQKYPDRAFTGTMDGTDQTTFSSTTREKLEAYAMLLRTEGWMATRLANLTRTAGVPKGERAKQAADDGLILAQMTERQLLSIVDTRAESAPATTYRSRGVYSWLSPDAQGVKPVPASHRPGSASRYTGALASFLPTNMEDMLEQAANERKGAVNLAMFAGLKLKKQMSSWNQKVAVTASSEQAIQAFNMDASEKKLIRVIDYFEFDAGEVKVMPSWYLACEESTGAATNFTTRSGVGVDLSMWEICFIDNPAKYDLEDKGGGPRGYHDEVYILKCLNPLGQVSVLTDT